MSSLEETKKKSKVRKTGFKQLTRTFYRRRQWCLCPVCVEVPDPVRSWPILQGAHTAMSGRSDAHTQDSVRSVNGSVDRGRYPLATTARQCAMAMQCHEGGPKVSMTEPDRERLY